MTDITTAELRKRILKEHGLIPRKRQFFLPDSEEYDESSVDYPKTDLMKYIESKYNIILKLDVYRGSINDVCSRYNWEVDRATISRWRKHIRRYLIQ
ncbi:hypothetical protein LCGC14_1391880 [marine sediment metagenome]|uniref:Uncharacterized protein n=1 Tax=marine sediment metagenome TaxID=412755 RepID=A0A0F9MFB2_9ZZZZ